MGREKGSRKLYYDKPRLVYVQLCNAIATGVQTYNMYNIATVYTGSLFG